MGKMTQRWVIGTASVPELPGRHFGVFCAAASGDGTNGTVCLISPAEQVTDEDREVARSIVAAHNGLVAGAAGSDEGLAVALEIESWRMRPPGPPITGPDDPRLKP